MPGLFFIVLIFKIDMQTFTNKFLSIKKMKILIFLILILSAAITVGQNSRITSDELINHVKYLSSDDLEGRFPGTKGDELTDEYIIGKFREYNIDGFKLTGYTQPFEIFTGVRMSGVNELNVMNDNSLMTYTVEKDFIPMGFSSSGIAEGKLVFAGYGITAGESNYDDYKDVNGNPLDVRDKIVIIMKYSPGGTNPHENPFEKYEPLRYKVMKAKEAGAAAVIIIHGAVTEDDKLSKLNFDNVPQNAGIPVMNAKREIVENILLKNGYDLSRIKSEIDASKKANSFSLPRSSAIVQVNVEPVRATTNNVLGFIEGSDPVLKDEIIVIGAHKDHLGYGQYGSLYSGNDKQIHNGADDNASGIAGLLEIAEKFSAERDKLRRSVLFIGFGAEEAGLLGSSYFTKSDFFDKLKIDAMINMDMIGRMQDDKLIIYGTGTSSVWNAIIDSINGKYNFLITKTPDGLGPSDHSSFYVKNIPVLHFFSGTHKDYHSPSDDYEKINSRDQEGIANFVYDVAMTLNNRGSSPDFVKVVTNNDEKRSMGNVKVYVGTIPDYSSTEEGLKLAGVKEGSPAEKGGLKANDLIIKFGDKDVKNIYDYMYAMGEYKPGDEIDVVVMRDKEKVILKVKLGTR